MFCIVSHSTAIGNARHRAYHSSVIKMPTPKSTRQWILENKPIDLPVLSGPSPTFKLITTDLPPLEDDQVLLKILFLSNDPAHRSWIAKDADPARLYVPPVAEGSPMAARGIGKIIESKSSDLQKGTLVAAEATWSEYRVVNAKDCVPIQDVPGVAPTHFLGALGMTGLTAYYGIKIIARAGPEDTVIVSAAAGGVGSMVVQIAKKLLHCKKVIGLAGTDSKCEWVKSLGADISLNYKSPTYKQDLAAATEPFASVYFDNVGGETLDSILPRMGKNGRIAACGAVSNYNNSNPAGLKNYLEIILMRLELQGFMTADFMAEGDNAAEATQELIQAVKDGKITVGEENETIVETGFEGVPGTWMKLFEGVNRGKLVTELVDG